MRYRIITGAALVAGAILAAALTSAPAMADERGGHGPGMMSPGMGHGYGMMGHGHGKGHGHGMMGRGGKSGCGPGMMGGSPVDKELSVENVTKILEGRLAWRGNDRLKVGKVEEKDEKTIIAEIVTVDDSLVKRLEFDRKTGRHRRIR